MNPDQERHALVVITSRVHEHGRQGDVVFAHLNAILAFAVLHQPLEVVAQLLDIGITGNVWLSVIFANRRFDTDEALIKPVDTVVQLTSHHDQVLGYFIELGVELVTQPADDGYKKSEQGCNQ